MQNMLYIVLFFSLSSCAYLTKPKEEKAVPVAKELSKEDIQALNDKLFTDIKGMLKTEILPKIKSAGPLPNKLLKNQKKARILLKDKLIIGRVEWIRVDSDEFRMRAKIDTGARTCSIHAENIKEKNLEGKKYIQFESLDFDQKKHVFLKEVIKSQKVKSSNGTVSNRYVIKMNIKLGDKSHDVHVNLNDREDLKYNFLIGRNLLRGSYIVDVVQTRLLGE